MFAGTQPPAIGQTLQWCHDEHADQRGDHAQDQAVQPGRPGEARHGETEGGTVEPAPEAEIGDARHAERRHRCRGVWCKLDPTGRVQGRHHSLMECQHRDGSGDEAEKDPHQR